MAADCWLLVGAVPRVIALWRWVRCALHAELCLARGRVGTGRVGTGALPYKIIVFGENVTTRPLGGYANGEERTQPPISRQFLAENYRLMTDDG
ncbi:MAG: hypothetical protein WBA89_14360 [Microcoleus sp.]|uniref:hypothetical protein n=1 Tax=Microcoleus sp. TaxID=44472 RepID=UPI003C779226